jgi:cell division protein FtsQ
MKHHHRMGKLALLALPLLALGVGLLESPLLRVEQVTIVAPTPELAAEVGRQVQLPPDASALLTPLCRVCEQARTCYRVEDCSVRRQLPHGLLVRVTARQPIAALRDVDGYTLVSREGICLYRRESRPGLPILRGLGTARPPLGSRIEPEHWRWARDLLAGATKAGLREGLEMDFTQPYQISVKTSAGWRGSLGNVNSLTRKVTIMGRLAEQLRREGQTPRMIDVSIPEAPRWTTI